MTKIRAFLVNVSRRDFWIGLGLALVTVGIIWGTAIGTAKINESQLAITCQSARTNISQLEALRQFARTLGVPWMYPIPEVPVECNGH